MCCMYTYDGICEESPWSCNTQQISAREHLHSGSWSVCQSTSLWVCSTCFREYNLGYMLILTRLDPIKNRRNGWAEILVECSIPVFQTFHRVSLGRVLKKVPSVIATAAPSDGEGRGCIATKTPLRTTKRHTSSSQVTMWIELSSDTPTCIVTCRQFEAVRKVQILARSPCTSLGRSVARLLLRIRGSPDHSEAVQAKMPRRDV